MPFDENTLTADLITELEQAPLTQPAAAIVAELKDRIILASEADDETQTGEYERRGGIRPYRAPRVI